MSRSLIAVDEEEGKNETYRIVVKPWTINLGDGLETFEAEHKLKLNSKTDDGTIYHVQFSEERSAWVTKKQMAEYTREA